VVGPATVAGLRRAGTVLARESGRLLPVRDMPRLSAEFRLVLLVLAAFLVLLIADLSGMSKAETERIWLPFALWLLAVGALLPRSRAWLATQAGLALLLNHLLLTGW
jgi:hypothetical protein